MRGWSVHGGKIGQARVHYAQAPEPWLDLSTGINPHPWPGAGATGIDWRALPDDTELAALEAAAADHFGVAARHVCALPGTEAGLRLLGHLPLPRPACHVAPGYRTHAEAIAGSRAIAAVDVPAMVERGATVLLANPNNPDGRIIQPAILENVIGSDGYLIIDESFADAAPAISAAPHVADDRSLLIFRSFGKFFGLAGVRLGFAIGPVDMVSTIRRQIGHWPVSAAAIQIGTAAYRDIGWIVAMRETLASDAAALDGVLQRHGFRPVGGCPLFRLIETEDAAVLFDRLAHAGILTRPFDYDPCWLRIGLPGSAEGLDRLDRALGRG